MRVLGIDPGSRITGFGVVQMLRNGRLQYVASGCVRAPTAELAERLKAIYRGVDEIIATYQPTVLAAERIFMARNADSALKLGQARGAALCAGINAGLSVSEYSATEIKSTIVGRGRADKRQVQHMVRVLLDLDRAPPADAADALACAICHVHHTVGMAARRRGMARQIAVPGAV
ncbi:MAG: crossover junction endodeoxyribonuclease RuvC [Candidatus Muproteobacteria bacterium RBG_16_60_9]|uniref:Crossover junction endodeoxyribonuclease RuvC n=1 Tax=Candidatus Muproteobacteria bacterium RBG_16_60_9 TaxID=1817755 RepID=A0A1F6V9D1_9PROT|nr:MAG: crossover junction endodeoxyribonuclease RuvC [Candidatus Muproteobacteria bacterium RBG_16_60_9]